MALRSCFCGSSPLAAARYQKQHSMRESGVWVCGGASFVTIESRVTALKLRMEAEARDQHRPRKLPATHVHRNSSQRCFRGGRFSVPSSSTTPAARFEGQKQQEVFKSYSIRSEVWRLWRPKKSGTARSPRGCPEPSRLEGH